MLQNPTTPVTQVMNVFMNSPVVAKCAGSVRIGPTAPRPRDDPDSRNGGHHQHQRRRPVLEHAHRVHAAVDDADLQRPEEQEGDRRRQREAERWSRRRRACRSAGQSASRNVFTASPPMNVWMPNHPHATMARSTAGTFAPFVPNDARASTGNGMPYCVPGCALSRIGTGTLSRGRRSRRVKIVELTAEQARPVLRTFPVEVPVGVAFAKSSGMVVDGTSDEFEALAGRIAVFRFDPVAPT